MESAESGRTSAATRFGRAQSRWVREDYYVVAHQVEDIVARLGRRPEVDVFATAENARFPRFWGPGSTEASDAFTQHWGKDFLWLNPPYSRLKETVAKLRSDAAHGILVVPEWPSRVWHREAMDMGLKTLVYPKNAWFFEAIDAPRRRRLTWPVRVILFCGHSSRCSPTTVLGHTPSWTTSILRRYGRVRSNAVEALPTLEPGEESPGEAGQVQETFTPHPTSTSEASASPPTSPAGFASGTVASPLPVNSPGPTEPRRMLDLFSGTGSVGRVYQREGFEVTTVDSDPRWGADIQVDVLEWDYKAQFKPGHFEVIVCGLPCTEFSVALTTRPRNLDLADQLAEKALEIIRYLKPRCWWLESPRWWLLRRRTYMAGLPYINVDYCQYAEWGYQKPTRI